ncbi:MAG: hypothetical protein A2849_02460 [Candidatus Taylorbacteria bacterium RIFCSPHIGHO2_01_FULL_51_15]|uniref:Uncharacterized protein n=1 Tax=Candidatus Taylorbacteria bacterium RIFCSPHIGHO2_01_FULL_51_15 TaxID=1802304 RepID=A0A1G2MA45_9BACT|nr:MAG: hypothetical protein A2849_02460 [Candidatus Taylorbacteria bacterium RIFCSPHIGHO2_01_FULL_51_15]
MSNVEFSEEEAYNAALHRKAAAKPVRRLSTLPIRLGLAKDETGATIILIGVAIVVLVTMAAVLFFATRSPGSSSNFSPGQPFPIVPGPTGP